MAAALAGGATALDTVWAAPALATDGAATQAGTSSSNYTQDLDKDPYFTKPAAITDIAETHDYDVVVIGAGAAGVVAALAATDNGATVGVLQKASRVYSHGILFGSFNAPTVVAETGVTWSDQQIDDLKKEFCELTGYGCQTDLLNRYFDNVAEAMEWHIQHGIAVNQPHMIQKQGAAVMWFNQTSQLNAAFAKVAETQGATFYYSTPGVQLVQDSDGAVTGAIGRNADGEYIQLNAKKGVVIATGAYGGNRELLERWCPDATIFPNGAYPTDNTGDGDLMAIWAGADISPLPHSKKVDIRFYGTSPARTDIEKQPFLLVNDRGHRMGDEGATEMLQGEEMKKEPSADGTYYCIFDADYGTWLTALGQDRAILTDADIAEYEALTPPILFHANTIAELAKKIGVDADELQKTIDRNNELAAAGKDLDFYKDPKYLYRIEKGPFYAMTRQYTLGAILGGLKVDADCNVIDRSTGEPIKGLYAVGNDMGGLQTAKDYVWHDYGMTLSCATVFGYLVGKQLATT